MAESIPSAAPPYAIKVWADDLNIYAELPSINQPCVIAAPISESGLSRILTILGAKHITEGHGESYRRPVYIAKELQKEGLTQHDLDKAREALKLAGLIK